MKRKFSFSSEIDVENAASDLGLKKTYAYYCERCNYLWFPKDFDPTNMIESSGSEYFTGQNIFDREPPKACARCKSKYWKALPQRSTENTFGNLLGNKGDPGLHTMNTVPRLRAKHRQVR